jgi:DNA-binding transcriptional ArsR family regulator
MGTGEQTVIADQTSGSSAGCDEEIAGDVRAARSYLIEAAVARDMAGAFKALSDPTRLRIISALSAREFCVNDLAAALEMSQSAVSHQLSDMRELRLVRYRREGRHVFYALDDEHVSELFQQALAHARHE